MMMNSDNADYGWIQHILQYEENRAQSDLYLCVAFATGANSSKDLKARNCENRKPYICKSEFERNKYTIQTE